MLDQELRFANGASNYDKLKGAEDRSFLFRAPRHRAAMFFGEARPHGRVDGHPCTVNDISFSGVSFIGDFDDLSRFEVGRSIPLRIEQANRSLYEGRGTLRRVEESPKGVMLAFSFEDGAVDLNALANRNLLADAKSALAAVGEPARADVPTAYRVLCADAVAFLNRFRVILDRIPAGELEYATGSGFDDVLDACLEKIEKDWGAIIVRGNKLVAEAMRDRAVFNAVKEYTERTVTPILTEEATWARAYDKPFGYPGDYLAMDAIYANERRGHTLFQKFLHMTVQYTARGLMSRMWMMGDILKSAQTAAAMTEPFRAMNLGCGPATEVVHRLATADVGPQQLFTLIDQDEGALGLAIARARTAIARAARGDDIVGYNISFLDLLRENRAYSEAQPQDVIYSVGVLDYLNDRLCNRLVKRLVPKLKIGGKLVIANVNTSYVGMMWQTGALLDWELIYRDRRDMLAMAAGVDGVECNVLTDPTDNVEFLVVKRVR